MNRLKENRNLIIKNLFIIVLANLFCVTAINGFFIPNALLSGGIGGISIMIRYLTGIPTGIIVLAINIPLFLYGFTKVDRRFATYGLISMVTFSILLTLTDEIAQYININDVFVAAIVGGVLNGIGLGLLFKNKMGQDGSDIIVMLLKRRRGISVGTSLLGINSLIVIVSSIIFDFRLAVYTIIGIYMTSTLVDKIRVGLNIRKGVFIISDKDELIAKTIKKELGRNVTFLDGVGSYRMEKTKVIYIIVNKNEIIELKTIVEDIDHSAFITINAVTEVRGSTFESMDL